MPHWPLIWTDPGCGGTGCSGGCGLVFKLTPPASGTTWTETPIYSFAGGSDGSDSHAGLVQDAAGNLYGTTVFDGNSTCQCGTVFKVTSSGTETVLHAFTGRCSHSQLCKRPNAAGPSGGRLHAIRCQRTLIR